VALSFLYNLARRLVEFVRVQHMDELSKDAEIVRGARAGSGV
jgi:hypothetical protein